MGFFIEGYFLGLESRDFKNDDGSITTRCSVNIATGSLAYRVYLADEEDVSKYGKLKPGEVVTLSVRVYVGKNGKLSLVDGKSV